MNNGEFSSESLLVGAERNQLTPYEKSVKNGGVSLFAAKANFLRKG